MTREKLAERIRKLLALAGNNPSEAEAAMAMERASALLAEHNLTMAEVETLGTDDGRVEDTHKSERARQTWARSLWGAVADLNFCFHCYTPRSWGPTSMDEHILIGTRANVEATKAMALYLVETVERLARECPDLHGPHERHAFKLGCSRRLCVRLRELQRQRATAATSKRQEQAGGNLPALASLYEAHELANKELYLQRHGRMPQAGRSVRYLQNWGAYELGKEAGDRVGLDTQIKSRRILSIGRR
jgi:hypothetical protein